MQRVLKGLRRNAGAVALVAASVGMLAGCNQHPVTFAAATGAVEFIQTTSVDGSTKLDMLWVVDNSGSMCQEQTTLRNNFELFIEKLDETNLDFHIGVTTTDMNPDYALEPVASPGILQSTPQPVPGFDRSCHTAVDPDTGAPIQGNYQPIKDAIAAAVGCMTTPDNSYLDPSNADIECALYGTPMGCSIARAGCGGGTACSPESLFPPASSYRAIPKVLRSADYKNGASLDIESLKADFACMSLVGTRGYGIEKGLSAAVEATKREKTGGAEGLADANTSAPNYGLIRPDARFAVVFVTDENDCSHDGSLAENTACGGDVCEFANKEGGTGLVDPAVLKEELMTNLRETKGDAAFGEADVLVASIHGNFKRFEGAIPSEADCSSTDYEGISPSCATALGVAYSGDRYERFLRSFPEGQYFPEDNPSNPDAALTGWMCTGDFRPALSAIGEFFSSASGGCITREIFPCETSEACPAFPYTGTAGSCVARPNSEPASSFCDSAVQVRAVAPDSAGLETLRASGYCIESSVGDVGLSTGCVIDSSKFSFEACSGGVSGIRLSWADETEARNALLGSNIQLRYNSLSSN